jgi:hypothetical protein
MTDVDASRLKNLEDTVINHVKQEIEYQREARSDRIHMRNSITCLHDGFVDYCAKDEIWKARFEPYLTSKISSQEDMEKLFKEYKHKILLSLMLFGTGLVIAGFMIGLNDHWHALLEYMRLHK